MRRVFTSESITEGHPDKVCDRVADAVLDAILRQDPDARVACECAVKDNYMLIMGEITSAARIDAEKIAREKIREIGYTDDKLGFSADGCTIDVRLGRQSGDIALGVDRSFECKGESCNLSDRIGAGDQGMMYGYACTETPEYMPLALMLSHKLCKRLEEVRKSGLLPYLRPDGKGQVSVEYENGRPSRIAAVVLSAQHDESVSAETLRVDLKKRVIGAVLPEELLDGDTVYYINPTGRFEIGGPAGDSGLTGRKIIVDTYGGRCPHGGGSFSGKDPTKVDRSAAYMARYVSKNVVAAGLAEECVLELAYAIGVAHPVSVYADTRGTGKLPDGVLSEIVKKEFDLRPYAIIETLDLKKPVYERTSVYGHFGKEGLSWERTDRVNDLKKYLDER